MCKAVLGEFNPNTAGHDEYTAGVETEIRWGEKTAKYWENIAHHQTFHVAFHISKSDSYFVSQDKYLRQIWNRQQVNLPLWRHLLTFLQHSFQCYRPASGYIDSSQDTFILESTIFWTLSNSWCPCKCCCLCCPSWGGILKKSWKHVIFVPPSPYFCSTNEFTKVFAQEFERYICLPQTGVSVIAPCLCTSGSDQSSICLEPGTSICLELDLSTSSSLGKEMCPVSECCFTICTGRPGLGVESSKEASLEGGCVASLVLPGNLI